MIAPLPNVNLADNETTEQPRRSIWGRQIIGSREACSLSSSLIWASYNTHTHTYTFTALADKHCCSHFLFSFILIPESSSEMIHGGVIRGERCWPWWLWLHSLCLRAEVNRQWTHTLCAGGACALGLPRADWRVVGSEVSAQGAAKPAGGADTLGTMFSSTPPSFALSHSLPLSHSPSFNVLLVVSVHDGLCLCSKNKNWALRKRHGETNTARHRKLDFKHFLNTMHLIKIYIYYKYTCCIYTHTHTYIYNEDILWKACCLFHFPSKICTRNTAVHIEIICELNSEWYFEW